MNPKIFAIILNWNNYNDTKDSIESLQKSSLPLNGIIVVDNGSQDGSIELLKKDFENAPFIHFIYNPKNYGFAKGMNVGIRHALNQESEFVFLLNNDAVADVRCVEKLYSAMLNDPLIGIAGPGIFYYTYPEQIWHGAGYFSWLRSGPVVPEKNLWPENGLSHAQSVFFLTGCALLIKRELFEKIGLLDEDYFLYTEDLDFCLRAVKSGFKLIYVPEAKVWHKISPTLKNRVSPLVMYNMARSRIIFLRKNFPLWYFIYGFLAHLVAYTPYRIWQARRSKKPWESILAWFRGTISGF